MTPLFYMLPMFVTAFLSTAVGGVILRRRPAPGAIPLAVIAFSAAVWSLGSGLRVDVWDLGTAVWLHKVEVLGMVAYGPAWFMFAAEYAGRERLVTVRKVLLLSIVPVVTVLLAWTNELHGLFWTELSLDVSGSAPVLVEAGASWWWIDTAYAYSLVVMALVVLGGTFVRTPHLYQRQLISLIVAIVLPMISDIAYIGHLTLVNLTPVAFAASALVLFFGFFRLGLLEVVPTAHDLIVEHMDDGLIVLDSLGNVVDANPVVGAMARIDLVRALGAHYEVVFADHPELLQVLAGNPRGQEVREWRPHRGDRVFDSTVREIRDRRGRTRGRLVTMRDVTEQRRAEEALQRVNAGLELRVAERTADLRAANIEVTRSQRRMQFLVDLSPAVIYTCGASPPYLVTFMSENARSRLGYAASNFLEDQDFWERHVHPDDRDTYNDMTAVLKDGHEACDYRVRTPEGDYRWLHDEMTLVRDAEGIPLEVVGILVDVTRQRGMEEQLRQSQKMEAVGLLAGGVAHDFNNYLTAILGYSDMLADSLHTDDERRIDVLEIHHVAERAAALTRQLLAFSRRQVMRPRIIDLNDVVRAIQSMLGRLIGEHIELEVKLDPELPAVEADPSQIEQVCINLIVNARDAMPRGGKLSLHSAPVWVDVNHPAVREGLASGLYACLTVSDSGHGMDEYTRSHLFEPFFTTKGVGGTGLGLATVFGIVKQSGGHIRVDSQPGRGTRFQVFLCPADGPVEVEVKPQRVDTIAGTGRILVVEDEDAVRRLAMRALGEQGYSVLGARDGAEALSLLEANGAVDLVLADVVMPRMGGRELAERLSVRAVGVKVLVMSGYAANDLNEGGAFPPGVEMIDKPFSPAELVSKVAAMLEGG